MKAVIASKQFGVLVVIINRQRPKLCPTYTLVKTKAVVANPADYLYLTFRMGPNGSSLGNNYVGIVEEVGAGVLRDFKVGDRVCRCTRGGNPGRLENGIDAEYVVLKSDVQTNTP